MAQAEKRLRPAARLAACSHAMQNAAGGKGERGDVAAPQQSRLPPAARPLTQGVRMIRSASAFLHP